MKIGIDGSFFSSKYEGGKEQVLMNLLKGLHELGRGKDIRVFGLKEAEYKFREVCGDLEYIAVDMHEGILKRKLFYGIWFRTFILPRLAKEHEIDILVFPVAYTGFGDFDMPTVVIPHDIQFKSNPSAYKGYEVRLFHLLYGNDFRKRDIVVAISGYDRDELTRHYDEYRDKVRLIYNPIDFDGARDCDSEMDCEGHIFANNLAYEHKNLKTLLLAFESIMDKIDRNLVISGTLYRGDRDTNELMDKLERTGRVLATGYLPKVEYQAMLKQADLFVNTSSFEGFGMPAVEAMNAGLACLLADNSAVKEVTLGRASYYRPADDYGELAKSLLEALGTRSDPLYLEETSRMVRERYDYRRISEKYLDLFDSLCK